MICNLTYDDQLGRVLISATQITGGSHADVERRTGDGSWVPVRGGTEVALAGDPPNAELNPPISDYEFLTQEPAPSQGPSFAYPSHRICPTGAPAPALENCYRVRSYYPGNLLDNPEFETDVDGWSGENASIAHSTAQAHSGTGSMLITPSGTDSFIAARSDSVPVDPSGEYTGSYWAYSDAGWSHVLVGLLWLDSGGSVISESLSPLNTPIPAATWTHFSITDTPPAGAVSVSLRALMGDTPSASDTLYADDALVSGPGDPVIQDECEECITPEIDGVWLKSIYHPFLNRKVKVLRDFDDVNREFRGGVFDVIGSARPIAITDLRGSREWTLGLCTTTAQEAGELDLLLATGDPLFLQVPGDSNLPIPSMHIVINRTTSVVKRAYADNRVWTLPFVEVSPPAASIISATATWATVLRLYNTWQEVLDNHPTWADLLQLVGSGQDVLLS